MGYQPKHRALAVIRRLSWRTRVLAVAGVAAATGLGGMTLAAGAGAAVNTAGHVFTHEESGFQASSLPGDPAPWHYRYVQGQLSLPDVTGAVDKAVFPGGFGASVRLTDSAETAVLGISTLPSSGVYNAAFALEGSDGTSVSCANGNSPATAAGDTVELSLYFTGSAVQYNATDKTTGKVFSGSCATPNQAWTSVQIGNEFAVDAYGSPSGFTPPASGHFRLDTFTNTVVTSRTGIRGSAGSASWPVQNLVMTSDGTSGGALDSSTPFAWGSYASSPDSKVRDGRNFGVWLPSNPDYPAP